MDLAAHQARELLADGEAQPRASQPMASVAHLFERPEDCLQMHIVYADACVLYLEKQSRWRQETDAQTHAPFFGKCNCIGEQIEQYVEQPCFVNAHAPGRSGAISQGKANPLSLAFTRIVSAMKWMNRSSGMSERLSSIFPASIFAISRMSLMSVSKCSPLRWITRIPSACRWSRLLSRPRICA